MSRPTHFHKSNKLTMRKSFIKLQSHYECYMVLCSCEDALKQLPLWFNWIINNFRKDMKLVSFQNYTYSPILSVLCEERESLSSALHLNIEKYEQGCPKDPIKYIHNSLFRDYRDLYLQHGINYSGNENQARGSGF